MWWKTLNLIKSYLKGQDMFCIDEDKRVKPTN